MNHNYKKILQSSLLVAISGTLYGFLGYLGTNIIQDNMSILTMLFWRFFIAGVWILLFCLKNQPINQLFNSIDKRILFFMFSIGAIGYAGASEFFFIASQYTGTGIAMVIFFSYPILVAVAAMMKDKSNINLITILSLIAITVGLFFLRDSSAHQTSMLGILFSILAAVCYGVYVIGSKRVSSVKMNSNLLTVMVCFGCAFIFLICAIFSKSFSFPHSLKTWLYLLTLGIAITALPIQLMLEGLKYVSSMRASIISVLEPLVTVFVGILLLNESVSHVQILGIVIVLTSALLVQFQKEL